MYCGTHAWIVAVPVLTKLEVVNDSRFQKLVLTVVNDSGFFLKLVVVAIEHHGEQTIEVNDVWAQTYVK